MTNSVPDPFPVVTEIRVEHLFISPGHNFFGHHLQPAGKHRVEAVAEVECVAGRGLRGDRFFDYKADYKGQITFFAMEVLQALRQELNLPEVQPQATRRNVFVRGADLNELIGKRFAVQGVLFAGVEESRPCYWMNSALGPGAEEWLRGRAGLRCRILTDGTLKCEGLAVPRPSAVRLPVADSDGRERDLPD
jgi:MOSC domain-containing protein YiiM